MSQREIEELQKKKDRIWFQIEGLQEQVSHVNHQISYFMNKREMLFKSIEAKSNEAQLLAEQIDGAIYENMKTLQTKS